MGKILTFFTVCALCVSNIAWAKTDVHEFTLDNGLVVLVKPDHRSPTVVSQIWYKVGSSYEPAGITGISHALEHMMFQGTKKYPADSFFKIVAENGGEQNAATTRDVTYYYQQFSNDKLPLSFELEADRMQNLVLNEEDFTKEIEVVKEERLMSTDNDPQSLTYERFIAAAFLANTYHHPVIGWRGDLDNMKVEDLRKWYDIWYAPNNAVLVVVGDVDPKAVHKLAKQYFGKIKPSQLPVIKPHAAVKPLGQRTVTVKAPAKVPFLLMGYNTPSIPTDRDSWQPYALEVLSGVLSGGNSGRLTKNLVRGEQVASSANAYYDLYSRLSGLFMFAASPAQGTSVSTLQKAILQQVQQLQQTAISSEELERVKAQVIASNVYARDSLSQQARLIGMFHGHGLTWREIDNYQQQIRKVTAEQVQQVAQEYLKPDHLTIAVLEPQAINSPAVGTTEGEQQDV